MKRIIPHVAVLFVLLSFSSCAQMFGTIGYAIGALMEFFLVIAGFILIVYILIAIIGYIIHLFK